MNTIVETKPLRSTKGTIWQVGQHKIACGDARDSEILRRLMSDRKIKSVICDVPYGIKYTESKAGFSDITVKKNIANDDITDEEEYAQFNEAWLSIVIPYLEKKNSIYVFNCDKLVFALRESFVRTKVRLTQILVWIKNQPVIGRMDYLPMYEMIAYGWYGKHEFVRAKDKSVLY